MTVVEKKKKEGIPEIWKDWGIVGKVRKRGNPKWCLDFEPELMPKYWGHA